MTKKTDIPPDEDLLLGDPCTDSANAHRFVDAVSNWMSGPWVRFVTLWDKWLIWDQHHWREDDIAEVYTYAQEAARAIYREAAAADTPEMREKLSKWAVRSEGARQIKDMIFLASKQTGIPVRPGELDANPWYLNVVNGTIDLRTGKLLKQSPKDLITKMAPVVFDPHVPCPRWEKFLSEIMDGNDDLVEFLKRAIGYSLTGDDRERCIFILHGAGRNGKSTLLEMLRALMGDYCLKTPIETLLIKKNDHIPNDVARLRGARLVYSAESAEGRQLNEALIKDLTGREHVSARFLFKEWFDFVPEFKLWLGTNHKPEIRGSDTAIWDRIRLIPFNVRFEGDREDKHLKDKLLTELGGILRWAMEGCLEWQRDGLGEPEDVKSATESYREEMDPLAEFLEACCLISPQVSAGASDLFRSYMEWAKENNQEALTQKAFSGRLVERGFVKERETTSGRVRYLGVGLYAGPKDCGSPKGSEGFSR